MSDKKQSEKIIESVIDELNNALHGMHWDREAHQHEINMRKAKIDEIYSQEKRFREIIGRLKEDLKDGKFDYV